MQGTKSLLLAAALATIGVVGLNATTAEARTVVSIYATSEPPPLREEHIPPPRHGYVWAPGYWSWSKRHYAWQRGHWERERHGYHYSPARWEREGDRWRYYGGRWDH